MESFNAICDSRKRWYFSTPRKYASQAGLVQSLQDFQSSSDPLSCQASSENLQYCHRQCVLTLDYCSHHQAIFLTLAGLMMIDFLVYYVRSLLPFDLLYLSRLTFVIADWRSCC